jgi:hypothetical protein
MRTLVVGGVFYKTLLLIVYAGSIEKSLAFSAACGRGVMSDGSKQE